MQEIINIRDNPHIVDHIRSETFDKKLSIYV